MKLSTSCCHERKLSCDKPTFLASTLNIKCLVCVDIGSYLIIMMVNRVNWLWEWQNKIICLRICLLWFIGLIALSNRSLTLWEWFMDIWWCIPNSFGNPINYLTLWVCGGISKVPVNLDLTRHLNRIHFWFSVRPISITFVIVFARKLLWCWTETLSWVL